MALAATRYERTELAYSKTQSCYSPPSKFTAGYAHAVEFLEMQEARSQTPYQGYKYADVVIDDETGKVMEYRDLLKDPRYTETWSRSGSNEFGRLFQGVGKNEDGTQRITGTDACHFKKKSEMPAHKRATYARYVVDIRPEKKDPNRVRITAGGDRLEYHGETSTESASLETAKILLNSVLSTKNAKFMSIDISNFYIQNDLEDYQWIRFHIDMIPQEIIDEYNLMDVVEDGWCYAEIRKALYGLKEATYLSNVKLKQILAAEGYVPSKFTPGLFTHKTRDIAFALCTDDFGCRYVNKEDAEHLI